MIIGFRGELLHTNFLLFLFSFMFLGKFRIDFRLISWLASDSKDALGMIHLSNTSLQSYEVTSLLFFELLYYCFLYHK